MERHAIIDYLAEETIEDRLVVFLGAGCSKWAGLPSWDELLVELKDKIGLKTSEQDLLRLASRLEDKMQPLPFREAIAKRLRVATNVCSKLHEAVADLEVWRYVTTNYDQLAENALRLKGISPKVIINPSNLHTIARSDKSVIKLHGDIDDPNSIVITDKDYSQYYHETPQFVDWLKHISAYETILYLGTSFRDSRLVEADELVIRYFGDLRRPHVIVLKRPSTLVHQDSRQDGSPHLDIRAEHTAAEQDFAFLVKTFKEKHFYVLIIDEYADLPTFVRELGEQIAVRKKGQLEEQVRASGLEGRFKKEILLEAEIDRRIKQFDKVFWIHAKEKARDLEALVKSEGGAVSPAAGSKAYVAVGHLVSHSRQKTDIEKGWFYLKKASQLANRLGDIGDLPSRLNRLRAKLLCYEGKFDEALDTISGDLGDPKTISIWLMILAESDQVEKVKNFTETHDVQPVWAGTALTVLCHSGDIEKARDLYARAIAHHEERLIAGDEGAIQADAENFCDVLKATLAFGVLDAVTQEARKDEASGLFPEQIDEAGIAKVHEALELVKDALDLHRTIDLSRSRSKFLAALVELQACHLLREDERAHEVASHLLRSDVVTKEVGSYIVSRSEEFSKQDLRKLMNCLETNYGETVWAINQRAGIHVFEFGEADTAWDLLLKSKELLKEDYDKTVWLDLVISVGRQLNRLDDVERLVKEVLPEEGIQCRLFNGKLAEIQGDHEEAEKYFLRVSDDPEAPEIEVFQALTDLSGIREKKGDLEKAREYLNRALGIHFVPLVVRRQLLRILIKLGDTGAIFERCQQLEQLGRADEATLEWQGQAAYALERLEESERVFKNLVSKDGPSAERAAHLALSVGRQGKHRLHDALDILDPYIKDHEQLDPECLEIAGDLLSMAGDDNAAWRLLGERFDHIQNNMRLLAKAMVLGFRTNNEHQAHLAMMRLVQLQEDKSAKGENVEPFLWKISIPDVIELSKRRLEAIERATRLYLVGDLPRWLATDVFGMTLHQDWAVRTQPLTVLPEDAVQRARYVTYSTPGMRLTQASGSPNWVSFEIPADIREIVIDAHAFITLHRLGLLSLMERRFDCIYYPRVFHDIWAQERIKYRHHQKSEADASREIVQQLDRNEITETESPRNDQAEPNEDRLVKDVHLAEFEGCPLVNAFASPAHFPDSIKVPVIRLFQLASWLFSAGKLSGTEHDRVSSIQEAPLMTTEAVEEQLDQATALVISLGTLKEICKLDILTELLGSGKKIMLEATSARIVRWTIKEVEFLKETGYEQERLDEFLHNSHVFVGQPVTKHVDTDKPGHELGYLGLMSTINLATEKQLYICTDDRAFQRFADPKWFGATFGTDALISDLYSKNMLNIEEYTKYFLQMCEWRYRFLIPDVQILMHLAREYRTSPPGKGLRDLANYWDECQQDAGLPLAVPPSHIIVPLGVKIWMAWHDAWVNMLIHLWEQEPQTCPEWLEKLTDAVLVELLPSPPATLIESVASNIVELQERSVFTHIFIAMSHSEHPEKLQPLASQTARLLLGNKDKFWQEAKEFLGWLSERAPQATDWMKICSLNVMKGLTGGSLDAIPRDLAPELVRLGITPNEKAESAQSEALKKAIAEARERLTEKRKSQRESHLNWLGQGAMLATLLEQGDKHFKYLILPHIAVSDHRPENRVGLVELLIERHDVSQVTSIILSKLLPEIKSPDPLLWRPAALEASKALVSDFHYTLSTFRQGTAQGLDQLTVSNLWEAIFSPRLETMSGYLPVLLQHSMEFTDVIDRVRQWSVKQQGESVIAIFESYRQEVGLIPFGPPLDPWTVLADVAGVFELSNLDSIRNFSAVIRTWAQKHHDPFCLLTGLTFLLCLRNHALDKGLGDLADEGFTGFVEAALKPLIITESQPEEPVTTTSFAWQVLSTFAPYWLLYLLTAETPKKIALPKAWWFAHVTFEALRMALSPLPEDRQNAFFDHLMNLFRRMIERANVESLLGMHPLLQELVKGLYLNFSHLLARATITALSQGSQEREQPPTPFGGLKGPPTVLSQKNIDLLIQEMARSTFWGEGQQIMDEEPHLPALWNSPSCVTGSRLLRGLSEVGIGGLKEPEMDMLRIAETVAEPSYVEKQLAELPNDYDRYRSIDAGLLWAGVGSYVATRGKIPRNFAVMWEKEKLKMLWGDDQRTRDFCLSKASELLVMLRRFGFEHEANKIASVFSDLPILEASNQGRETFCKHLALAIILGQSLSAFQPLIQLAKENNSIKKTLSNVRSEVRSLLPNLPIGRRSQARRFLRTLAL